uniref:GPW/gp25 family protein n=1 Tax=Altererythrobacter segetis TaxID=1104773 RepID=UPI00140D9036|nr:GPW/gp25 family protein [Altererythrobacter segetis]
MAGPVLSSTSGTQFVEPIGWPLMPVPDDDGRLNFPDLATSVRERIEAILRTAPGEQLMRPSFGVGLELIVHQPNTLALRGGLEERIGDHLAAFEPRILVDRVTVAEGDDSASLLITIAYRLRATGVAGRVSAQVPLGGA